MNKPENLKVGEYYGYRDDNGNWITGQNGPNPMTVEQTKLVDDYFYNYGKVFSSHWFKAVGKDIISIFSF